MTKKDKVVILADLGDINVYNVTVSEQGSVHLKEEDELYIELGHERNSDINTDRFGNHPNSTSGRHSTFQKKIDLEVHKREEGTIAEFLNLFGEATHKEIYLALSDSIHNKVLEKVKPQVKDKFAKVLNKDLTRVNKERIIELFELH